VSLVSEPTDLDPHTSTGTADTYVQRQINEPLIDLDENLSIPHRSWPRRSSSPIRRR
jgi:hypothetical protein